MLICVLKIEGFLEGENSTAPLVRYKRRTSQQGMSASQPAIPYARRPSVSSISSGSLTVDSYTPRTVIQKYLGS